MCGHDPIGITFFHQPTQMIVHQVEQHWNCRWARCFPSEDCGRQEMIPM